MSDGFVYLGGGTPTQRAAGVDGQRREHARLPHGGVRSGARTRPRSTCTASAASSTTTGSSRAACEFLGTVMPDANGTSAGRRRGVAVHRRRERLSVRRARGAGAARARRAGRPARRGGADAACWPRAAIDAGVRASYDTRAERLVVDGRPGLRSGRARGTAAEVAIRARAGVVLTAGGFIQNAEMIEQYAPAVLATPLRLGTEGDDGRGIRMAAAAGARLKRMDAVECALPFNAPRKLVHGILVNRLGPALRQRGHLPGPGRADRAARTRAGRRT